MLRIPTRRQLLDATPLRRPCRAVAGRTHGLRQSRSRRHPAARDRGGWRRKPRRGDPVPQRPCGRCGHAEISGLRRGCPGEAARPRGIRRLMNQHARLDTAPIPFIDVAAQRRRLGGRIDAAVARVLDHCQFILGPEVRELEAALAAFCGARHAVSCASGTDALLMVLMAKGIGAGDAVICPTFTFAATAEVVALVGATPVFADVEETSFNLDPESVRNACAVARRLGLHAKAIIPVDLFGQPADHERIAAVAESQNLFVLDDAAQAFGATYRNRRLGAVAPATATSFFPAKPLGCYGDGGAIFTDDDELALVLRSLRVHGEGRHRYESV